MNIMVGLYKLELLLFTNLPIDMTYIAEGLMVLFWQSLHDCIKVSCQSLYSLTVSKEGQRTMNCQIQAPSILLFAIVCSDDIAAPRKV